jgi:hypothetical protein
LCFSHPSPEQQTIPSGAMEHPVSHLFIPYDRGVRCWPLSAQPIEDEDMHYFPEYLWCSVFQEGIS